MLEVQRPITREDETKRNEHIRRDVLEDLKKWRNRAQWRILGPFCLGGVGIIMELAVLDNISSSDNSVYLFLGTAAGVFILLGLLISGTNKVDKITRNEVYHAIREDEKGLK